MRNLPFESQPLPEGPEAMGPWTRLRSRYPYENPWIRVREDDVLRPDQSPGIYGLVQFKNLAMGIVAVDSDNRAVMVGQYRYPLKEFVWEIPEGGCPLEKAGDMQREAARELEEETGYTASRWDYLGGLFLSNSVSDEVGHLYLARDLKRGIPRPEPTEELEVKLLPLEEAFEQAMNGALQESLTVVGLARAHYFLLREKRGNVHG